MRSQGTWLHSSGYGEFKCLDYIVSVIQTQTMWLPSTKKADNWKPGFSIIWKGLCQPSVTDSIWIGCIQPNPGHHREIFSFTLETCHVRLTCFKNGIQSSC